MAIVPKPKEVLAEAGSVAPVPPSEIGIMPAVISWPSIVK